MATLVVTGTHDYRGETPGNITAIVFSTTADATATFSAAQFGSGGITNNVAVTGDAFANTVQVIMQAGFGFSAAAWTFNNWVAASDAVVLDGLAGSDTITGSVQHDVINGNDGPDTITGGLGADTLNGGIGSDTFMAGVSDIVAGETIDGGMDFDELRIIPASTATIDLRGIAITNVEKVSYLGDGTLMTDGR